MSCACELFNIQTTKLAVSSWQFKSHINSGRAQQLQQWDSSALLMAGWLAGCSMWVMQLHAAVCASVVLRTHLHIIQEGWPC